MDYIELKIEITPFKEEYAEIVEAMLAELPFEAFTIDDPYLCCYIKKENFKILQVRIILSDFDYNPDFRLRFQHNLIMNQNWNREWEKNFTPIRFGELVSIKAPFHKNVPKAKYNIKIEPRMAFGTGHHQTTLLMICAICLLAGEDISLFPKEIAISFADNFHLPQSYHTGQKRINLLNNKNILDMGTGTGLLAILCAKLKAKRPVDAIDIDINAVNSALTNVWMNRLGQAIDVLCGDSALMENRRYNYIFANINRNILLEDLPTYSESINHNGIITLSGFYTEDIEILAKAAKPLGLDLVCKLELDGWAAIMLKKQKKSMN